jgi:hypothetical protein
MFGRLVAIDMALLTGLAERTDGGSIKMRPPWKLPKITT